MPSSGAGRSFPEAAEAWRIHSPAKVSIRRNVKCAVTDLSAACITGSAMEVCPLSQSSDEEAAAVSCSGWTAGEVAREDSLSHSLPAGVAEGGAFWPGG